MIIGNYYFLRLIISLHIKIKLNYIDFIDNLKKLCIYPKAYFDLDRIKLQELIIGYRDIGLTFLLVLGADLCLPLIDTITKSHFNCLAESISTLPKTLTSIILRNAIKYIHEIITVDDAILFLCIEGWNSSFPAA
ncbi:unnamed protein product [Rotaria socialis]